jgi:hypothetical protein
MGDGLGELRLATAYLSLAIYGLHSKLAGAQVWGQACNGWVGLPEAG